MKKSNLDTWIYQTEGMNENDFTREVLDELSLKRLNRLLQAKNERKLHSLAELSTLPFTTARMLSEAPGDFLMTSQSEISRIISGITSGTTGPSKRVFYTDRDTAHTIRFFAAGIGEMVNPADSVLINFPFSGSLGLGDLIEQAVHSLGAISIHPCPGPTFMEQCLFIMTHQPDCYIGAPVPLLSLARCCRLFFPERKFPIQRALISGDACPENVTDRLESLLDTKLFPHYGSRECGLGGAITCPAHEGMHLRENHILAEIVDKELHPVPFGTWGELVITTIGLSAMPLIRYRTGDYTRILPEPCPCGSILKRIDRVSRISEASLTQELLDDRLFQIPELIDCQASTSGNVLHITALVSARSCEKQILGLLHDLGRDHEICVTEKQCRHEDKPFYTGKRYLTRL